VNLNVEPVKVAEGFEFCEGPAFGPDGWLYLVNLGGGYLSKVSMQSEVRRWAETPGPNGGQFDADGNYVVCEVRRKAILAISPAGAVSVIADGCAGRPFNGPNDIAVDADGGLYFTDPDGSSLENRIGAVYHVRPDRTVLRVADGLAYPNGINVTVDRSAVIVAETLTHRIHRYERRKDGTLGERELYCQLEGGVGPDGMCFDMDGNLYVAHFGSGCVDVIDPSGRQIGGLATPGENPTNCCFGPPGSEFASSLFVTETVTDTLWRYDLDTPGMPLHHLAVASE
jgi:gluconolactonase